MRTDGEWFAGDSAGASTGVTPATSRERAANVMPITYGGDRRPWLRRSRWLPSLTSVPTSQLHRPRRRRRTDALRRLVREHQLEAGDLIQPLFVVHGTRIEREIPSMPGVCHLSVDESLDREVDRVRALGISGACCCSACPRPRTRSARRTSPRTASCSGRSGACARGIPDLLLITDVCCCEYTSHGHCGVLRGRQRGQRRHARDPRPRGASPTPRPAPTSWRRAA